MIPSFLIILTCFIFSAIFSGVETGSYMINRIRLHRRKCERRRSAEWLTAILRYPYIFMYTILIGNNLAAFMLSKEVTDLYLAGGMHAGTLLFGFLPWNAETAATLTLMFPLFLFGEVGPKNLFRKKADVLMYRLSGLLRCLVILLLPITLLLKYLFIALTHGGGRSVGRDLHRLSPDALREYFTVGEQAGFISSDLNRMIENVTTMYQVPVRMLMTPFNKMPQLPDTATVADLKKLLAGHQTLYVVLMHKHTVVGLVSMFTVINRKLSDADLLKPYAHEPLKLEESRNLKSAFYRLRRNPRHSAVVFDSMHHPVGFIRLEDIARYIAKK
ncbi:CNNM domain-containing protein [Pontiellaceae bacterium B12219]|nr:CNNM domain-containing protein [Pontiellaceae bacterium B12219]